LMYERAAENLSVYIVDFHHKCSISLTFALVLISKSWMFRRCSNCASFLQSATFIEWRPWILNIEHIIWDIWARFKSSLNIRTEIAHVQITQILASMIRSTSLSNASETCGVCVDVNHHIQFLWRAKAK